MSSSVVSIVISGVFSATSASTVAAASRRPTSEIAERTAAPCALSSSAVSSVSTRRLADFRAQTLENLADLADLDMRDLGCLEERLLGTWSAPASIIVNASLVPTTTRSRVDSSSASRRVDDELVVDARDADGADGPMNGSGDTMSAADAPLMQRMSCGVTRSAERTVQMTCTSFRNPFGQSGLIGRSIMRR